MDHQLPRDLPPTYNLGLAASISLISTLTTTHQIRMDIRQPVNELDDYVYIWIDFWASAPSLVKLASLLDLLTPCLVHSLHIIYCSTLWPSKPFFVSPMLLSQCILFSPLHIFSFLFFYSSIISIDMTRTTISRSTTYDTLPTLAQGACKRDV